MSQRNPPRSPCFRKTWCVSKARTPAPCCDSARRSKNKTTCRTCIPTSISTRRSWRPWPNKVLVLGVDCGTRRTGYGVIESDGGRHELIVSGVISTNVRDPFEARLHEIARGLRDVIGRHSLAAAAVEQVFYAANVRTALKLAHVRGVALLAIAEAGLQLGEYSPLEIKTSVVGYGQAGKRQVQVMVQSLLGLDAMIESEDACDALAVATCHATPAVTRARLQGV